MTEDRVRELIADVDRADSADGVLDAVKALSAAESTDAIAKLIEVLGYNNPGAAVAAVDGLVAIGEPAVLPLLEQLDGYNYGARAWAIRALAGIGDPRGLEILLTAAADFSLSVRRAAARGLGALRWQELERGGIADAQTRALETLLETTEDPEWVVRYAAVVGLEALATAPTLSISGLPIRQRFEEMIATEVEPSVRARVGLAIERIEAVTPSQGAGVG
ncbi:MAG TPA: HEAT repeat domain-containing protein [Oscillatoriales cyanobacterium M59_W2019_021]|nr:MAG: HEAT repeat domain-containing protein [Cyanobacteria bacterium J055]HIK33673.1 HEAT repeat domain-containing protein [Oscillatoriales cyanobacterium M4454_W2019_049]HIK52675.1 HEAT repeat domain-containing protein [Oscillatoriales cyanobacterium M59_W2019_021]